MHQTYHHYPLYSHGAQAFTAALPPMFPPYYPPSSPEYLMQEPCGVIPHKAHHACSCSGECRGNFTPHQRSFSAVSAHQHPHHPCSSPSPTRPIPIASSSSLPSAPSPYSSSSSSTTSGAAFYSHYTTSYPSCPSPVSPPWSVSSSSPQSTPSTSPPQSSSPASQRFCHIMPASKTTPKALLFIEERPNKPDTKPVLADGFNAPMPRTRKLCKRRKPVGGDLLSAFDPNYEFKPGMYCRVCGIVSTPQWRRGPDGKQSLCNACGLKFLKVLHQEKNSEAQQEPEKLSLSNLLN